MGRKRRDPGLAPRGSDGDAMDGQIDRLVYEHYGLTEEVIRIVEEGTR